ncbi:MAG: hypothetical protein E7295_06930 [Lachnospiraceae bacterium]|jgi:hypothetical protein|nr:hypothetical protein [Lachnospiraceae bacterium]
MTRLFLNYDLTYILISIDSALPESEKKEYQIKCPSRPWRKKRIVLSTEALQYVAILNYWLVCEKLRDNCLDSPNRVNHLVWKIVKNKKRFIKEKEQFESCLDKYGKEMDGIHEMEEHASTAEDFDVLTNAFGKLMEDFFLDNIEGMNLQTSSILKSVFFQLGKWVYVIDALDDYQRDLKKEEFNLFRLLQTENNSEEILMLFYLIQQQIKNKIITICVDSEELDEIVINVVKFGMEKQAERIIKRKYRRENV